MATRGWCTPRILEDEKKHTAAGFWTRARAFFTGVGVSVDAVMTDNGSCYRSGDFKRALGERVRHKRTKTRRPQTNGKVERFNRTLMNEWAYARPYASEADREAAYMVFLHDYNHHRAHTAIGGLLPADRVHNLTGKYIYPHKTVEQNMSFALQLAKVPREEISRRVRRAADQLGLTELLDRRPRQLSGGQRQRVAMGRAIVREPTVFLMDEPLSNLDARLRVQTRAQIAELQNRLGTTTVYVTHDQSEAMTLGDRVAVLHEGMLHQVAPPRELYDRPADIFVAGFIGSPAMNLLTITDDEFDRLAPGATSGGARADDVVFGVRPEHLAITPADAGLLLHIDHVEEFGAEAYAHGRLVDSAHTERVITRLRTDARPALGDTVRVVADPERVHTFDRATGQRIEANVTVSASAV